MYEQRQPRKKYSENKVIREEFRKAEKEAFFKNEYLKIKKNKKKIQLFCFTQQNQSNIWDNTNQQHNG